MYFLDYKRRPDLDDSTWGQHADPFVQYDPLTYEDRGFPVPREIRGRFAYTQQPRQLGPGAAYLPQHTTIAPSPYGEHPDDQKWGFIILLGLVGLIAFFAGSSHGEKKAKRNMAKWNGRRRRRVTPRRRRVARNVARSLPRDENGRFLPAGS